MSADQINSLIAQGDAAADAASEEFYRQAGERLVAEKTRLGHGNFGPWLVENVLPHHDRTRCTLCMAIYNGKTTLAAERKRKAEVNRRARELKLSLHGDNLAGNVIPFPGEREPETEGQTCEIYDLNEETGHGRKITTVIRHFEKLSATERSQFIYWLVRSGHIAVTTDQVQQRGA